MPEPAIKNSKEVEMKSMLSAEKLLKRVGERQKINGAQIKEIVN